MQTTTKGTYKVYRSGSTASSTFDQYTVIDDYKYGYELETDNLQANTGTYLELRANAETTSGFRGLYSGRSFTANSTTDTIILADHGLTGGELIQFSGSDLPNGISADTTYKVKAYDTDSEDQFQIELSESIVDFTDNGSGTMYFYSQLSPKIIDAQGFGTYSVPLWNHFRLFLTTGGGNVYGSYPLTTGLMYGGYQYYRGLPTIETIVTDDNVIDFSKVDILELSLDIKNRLYELVQVGS